MTGSTNLKTALILCAIVAGLCPIAGAYSGGSGTADDPYQIATPEDLIALGNEPNDYDKHFILTADIDLSAYTFDRAMIAPDADSSLGIKSTFFSGSFCGDDHVVRNLHIEGARYLGLFGRVLTSAVISNLGLEDVVVHSDDCFVGGLVGENGGILFECYSHGVVAGADDHIGGVVGINFGMVLNCHSRSRVTGESSVGGLIGSSNGSISNSYSYGTVGGHYEVGGLLGRNEYGNISNCYSTASMEGSGWCVGGLIGRNDGRSGYRYVLNCYSTGRVVGEGKLGGLIGDGDDSHVLRCFWDKETSGVSASAGGLGLTTAEMQDLSTYLNTGWDFAGESVNGTAQTWRVSELGGCPVLSTLQDEGRISLQGQGIADDPFLITCAQDLGAVRYRPFAHYRLETDIDFLGTVWTFPIVPWFGGSFDGNDHVIYHLCIQGEERLGLFGTLHAGTTIADLTLEGAVVQGAGSRVGAVAGSAVATVHNCHGTVAVTGRSYVGGLLGYNRGGVSDCSSAGDVIGSGEGVGGLIGRHHAGYMSNCSNVGAVTGSDRVGGVAGAITDCSVWNSHSSGLIAGNNQVGGLAGSVAECNVSDCHSYGTTTGDDEVGGLAGSIADCNVSVCYSGGAVMGNSEAGGLIGSVSDCNLSDCYSSGAVIGSETAGGLIGSSSDSAVSDCHSSGFVTGDCYVGGLVGNNDGTVFGCYSTGEIAGGQYTGGLTGYNDSGRMVSCSYSTGKVVGEESVGGLVGYNYCGLVWVCYSVGRVTGHSDVGGLIGRDCHDSVVVSFWDMETSGQTTSAGGTGRTTAQMQQAETFLAWAGCDNVGNWTIDEGQDYPRLAWENHSGRFLEPTELCDLLEGTGSENDPFLVGSAEGMNWIGQFPCQWDKHFALKADIDLSAYGGTEFHVIGDPLTPFTGVFDGGGHVVANLSYSHPDQDHLGLFGYVSDPNTEIRDVHLVDCAIKTDSGFYVGTLAGYVAEGAVVLNCGGEFGESAGDRYVGGLIGANSAGTIANCQFVGATSGVYYIGGLVGMNTTAGKVVDCYSSGTVAGKYHAGGGIGRCYRGVVETSYSTSSVDGVYDIGGLIGSEYQSEIRASFWDTETSGLTESDGGTGLTTARMMDIDTFLTAGWDFVDEVDNGTEDIWWIEDGVDYPRLWWEVGE